MYGDLKDYEHKFYNKTFEKEKKNLPSNFLLRCDWNKVVKMPANTSIFRASRIYR